MGKANEGGETGSEDEARKQKSVPSHNQPVAHKEAPKIYPQSKIPNKSRAKAG